MHTQMTSASHWIAIFVSSRFVEYDPVTGAHMYAF
jgi:hypothetical protein